MADGPALTEIQRLTLQNAILRAKLAKAAADLVIQPLLVDGYDLTEEGDYVKRPEPSADAVRNAMRELDALA